MYISLKEDDYVLDAVCWKRTQVTDRISAGVSMLLMGRIVTYAQRSKYQLVITDARIEKVDVEQQVELTKRKLQAEGLFDVCKKQSLPRHVESVGIITSESGAALFDMQYQFNACMPARILLAHAAVQGASAVDEIIAAIDALCETRVDVIVIARGGGSAEDLLAFNDERLVRKVAGCKTPILSAVGHEIDTTLCDLAADVRVPTPTAAPAAILSLKSHVKDELCALKMRSAEYISNELEQTRNIGISLEHLSAVCEMHAQYAEHNILSSYQNVMYHISKLDLCFRLPSVSCDWIADSSRVPNAEDLLRREYDEICKFGEVLEVSSVRRVLERGFCLIKSGANYKTSAKDCETACTLTAVFHDGEVELQRR